MNQTGTKTEVNGQIDIENCLLQEYPEVPLTGCEKCLCQSCLYWWSMRCPAGRCYDDLRAKTNPYNKAHPENTPRVGWSNWNRPGEQEHWCRQGICYPIYGFECSHYVQYKGQQVKTCLKANVSVFQDGYILCSIIDTVGCQQCFEEWSELERKREGTE